MQHVFRRTVKKGRRRVGPDGDVVQIDGGDQRGGRVPDPRVTLHLVQPPIAGFPTQVFGQAPPEGHFETGLPADIRIPIGQSDPRRIGKVGRQYATTGKVARQVQTRRAAVPATGQPAPVAVRRAAGIRGRIEGGMLVGVAPAVRGRRRQRFAAAVFVGLAVDVRQGTGAERTCRFARRKRQRLQFHRLAKIFHVVVRVTHVRIVRVGCRKVCLNRGSE